MARGRKTKLTPQLQKRICKALRDGNTRNAAALSNGICEKTFYTWLEKGEKAKSGIYTQFVQAVKKAEAQVEIKYAGIIKTAAEDTWQAAAWWLERRKHKDWGRKDRQEVSGPDGGPVQVIRLNEKQRGSNH